MNRDIPGYYFDAEKKKYFKIEASKTAPESAAWAATNVKRRQLEGREALAKRERVERRAAGRVKRARVLEEALTGGFLSREAGKLSREVVATLWVDGVREKGCVNLFPGVAEGGGSCLSSMYVHGGDEKSGLGVVYGVVNDRHLWRSYIPRDKDDVINFADAAVRYRHTNFRPRPRSEWGTSISSLKYHEPSNKMFITSGGAWGMDHQHNFSHIRTFSPPLSDTDDLGPAWNLTEEATETILTIPGFEDEPVNTCAPAPASSPLTCIFGTSQGIVKYNDRGLSWLTPKPTGSGSTKHNHRSKRSRQPKETTQEAILGSAQGEILALDFFPPNPADVILYGGRAAYLGLLDQRARPSEWSALKHTSSIAQIRPVGGHQVLVAGPKSAMVVYDMRYIKKDHGPRDRWNMNRARPLVTFPEYKNDAHIHTGLDVLPSAGGLGGCGIVAAAHDDGKVAVYSLRDGTRLGCPSVDKIDVGRGRGNPGGVVKSMMFNALPGDRDASLFVGEGTLVKKYSFGRGRGEGDEWV
ncbi:hypothetical protein B0T25DRAFT_615085 [Lasiosphaeria hispida]|uniref:Myocyte-specific enhancer factor 2d n=1 Tax=Lasiosphaeria hispida TaxID=260671 RepID=A0AAJ0H8P3_9PEZI|nr:hypothetical protein B0T25DRAFT_615085 [Lasiosphaeria hispida]